MTNAKKEYRHNFYWEYPENEDSNQQRTYPLESVNQSQAPTTGRNDIIIMMVHKLPSPSIEVMDWQTKERRIVERRTQQKKN